MNDRLVHAVEHLCENLLLKQDGPYRNMPARESLGDQDHIGLHAPVLDSEETAGPTQPVLQVDIVVAIGAVPVDEFR